MASGFKHSRGRRMIMWVNLVVMLLLLIAIATPYWSHGEAYVVASNAQNAPTISGSLIIGLWEACAFVSGQNVFKQPDDTGVDCRLGHCINSYYFTTPNNNQLSENLCDMSKAAGAFALGTLALIFLSFFQTSIRPMLNWQPSHGWALIFQVIAVPFSIISWAVWIAWQQNFNNGGTAQSADTVQIGTLYVAACPIFVIVCTLLIGINVWLEKDTYNEDEAEEVKRAALRASNRERLMTNDDDNMLTASGTDRAVINPQYASVNSGEDEDDIPFRTKTLTASVSSQPATTAQTAVPLVPMGAGARPGRPIVQPRRPTAETESFA